MRRLLSNGEEALAVFDVDKGQRREQLAHIDARRQTIQSIELIRPFDFAGRQIGIEAADPGDALSRAAGYSRYALGATLKPRTLCRSMRRATNPDAFASSTNSRRKAAPAAFFRGVPIAC